MKNVLLTLTLGCVPFAISAQTNCDYFGGIYIGGGLGFNALGNKRELTFDPAKVANTAMYYYENAERSTRLQGSGYVGYGRKFYKSGYAAIEAFVESELPEITKTTPNINVSTKQETAYGGRVKLGVIDIPWLVYGLAGLLHSNINQGVTFVNGGIYNSGTMLLQPIQQKESATIMQLGAGIDYSLTKQWAIQLEYAHNFYDKRTHSVNHTFITFNNPKGTYSTLFNGDEMFAGLRYRWA